MHLNKMNLINQKYKQNDTNFMVTHLFPLEVQSQGKG